ncbi:MAG: hypothetical protein JWO17_1793 [Actinomycetia bacterium]|nr:hypothetical protein [Actinomycetes bacterium]
MGETLVIAGALAQRPGYGGHTWVFLQYLLGFRRLGFDVVFVDWLSEEMCGGPVGQSEGARYLRTVMERFGLGSDYALLDERGDSVAGIDRAGLRDRLGHSSFLLNVMGYLGDEELLAAAPRRVFLDIDPGFPQMWRDLGLADPFAGHDVFVTIGENVGRPGCPIPTCGLDWVRTRQPLVLDLWPEQSSNSGRFTTVGSWRGAYGPIEWDGRTYGLRVHEFRKFVALPDLSGLQFEFALDIDDAETRDLDLLRAHGWNLVDPARVACDPVVYQRYVAGSKAEFVVAKNLYVDTHSGWFSDRSACYLASGKPVIAQDTGLDGLYPLGEGLVTFRTVDEAAAAVHEVAGDHRRHARAARELAEAYFDSDLVLANLVDAVEAA